MSTSALSVDVYVAPMRLFAGAPAQAQGDEPMWSPMSSTLIAGAEEAILVDTLVTVCQVDELAEWIGRIGKRITGVYITHGHSDHWIGLARLQEHFPEARGIATAEVVGRARFEALRAVSVGQSDTEYSTVLHVPSAAAVIGGDVVDNGVHMMTAQTG
jgi:glyoxylase-like metal-dependent hydrolase (beta-lactamase superfamily II)